MIRMAKKKVAPQETHGVLIKAATTIGRAAGKIAALVTSTAKGTRQEPRPKSAKSGAGKAKRRSTKEPSASKVPVTKARKTVKKRTRPV